ncbi:MAG TPA: sulfatase-like hydrolase/transferase [Tepidisphaeraceae bacterium]|jgi:arylsulfatase A-like enzyme|nr:sulfatase-like hydrolase/transferase [Tepidisphaeraceae bacterium]
MNLLLITSDQQHYLAMGVRSRQIRTPNLDRLAARGIDFTRAYCPNPTCTPTRSSLITGMWPSVHGAYTLGTKLDETVPVIGDLLRKQGYVSGLIGKAHFQPLRSTPECPSVEAYPIVRDLAFWRTFNEKHTPWYGFDHVELGRMHGDEGHVGQHYALWMESKGFKQWRDYFEVRQDGVRDTPTDGKLAPPREGGPGYGWRSEMHWKLPAEFHYTTWTGERTNAFIAARHAEGRPWFCWSSYHDPHPPYCVPEPWASMYDPAEMDWLLGDYVEGEFEHMPPPHGLTRTPRGDFSSYDETRFGNHGYHPHLGISRQQLREAAAIYCGMISFMDQQIGTTLDLLDRTGQADNTLIVFTSDHGHFLGQHGLVAKGPFHYEDVIRVPMLAAGAGLPAGVTNKSPQTLVDIPATFAAASGAGVPLWMQGRNGLPAWEKRGGRSAVIVENHHNGAAVHLRTVVTSTHKLTVYRGRPEWGELFDLESDPHERNNLYHADPALRAKLMEQLVQADLEREPAPQPRVSGA